MLPVQAIHQQRLVTRRRVARVSTQLLSSRHCRGRQLQASMSSLQSTAVPDCKPTNEMLSSIPTTIFEVMSKLAMAHGSVNLGQGFPDEEGPESMKRKAGSALFEFHNQYPPLLGVPELRQAVARHSEKHQGIPVDWQTETLITVGATEGIAACFLGLLNAGDEVVMFDPMYDSYVSMCKLGGGIIKPVRFRLPDFSIDPEELEAAFSSKTKFILINSPHNPSGKVFSQAELEMIAALCIKYNTYAVCDEVYEHLVFEGSKHISLRSLPGMKNRSIRLGSAGKTFSFTAWKVGWVTGPAHLLAAVIKAHQFLIFTVASNLQRAVADGLDNESSFYLGLGASLQRKRDFLTGRLAALGFNVLPTAQGAYFLITDVSRFLREGENDEEFCKRITIEAGVTMIPVSGFYVSSPAPKNLVRFCFCKDDSKLVAACERLDTYLRPPQGTNGNHSAVAAAVSQ